MGIGLANQGETVIAFDRVSGRPICSAISWQDRRAEPITQRWQTEGMEETIFSVTGLRLDPYFSAAKLAWILENVPEAASLRSDGRLCLGTSDAWRWASRKGPLLDGSLDTKCFDLRESTEGYPHQSAER